MSPLARVFDDHVGEMTIAVVDGEIDASNAQEIGTACAPRRRTTAWR